jgi:hypothetical protein
MDLSFVLWCLCQNCRFYFIWLAWSAVRGLVGRTSSVFESFYSGRAVFYVR